MCCVFLGFSDAASFSYGEDTGAGDQNANATGDSQSRDSSRYITKATHTFFKDNINLIADFGLYWNYAISKYCSRNERPS